jgi:hypothetical protein
MAFQSELVLASPSLPYLYRLVISYKDQISFCKEDNKLKEYKQWLASCHRD